MMRGGNETDQKMCGSQLAGRSTACRGGSDSCKAQVACDDGCRHNLVTPRPTADAQAR